MVRYGGVWHEGALPLATHCVHTLLCIWVAGYGGISSLAHVLAVDMSDDEAAASGTDVPAPSDICVHTIVYSLKLRDTAIFALFPSTAVSRVRRCGVLRCCVHSLCGLRALAVVHWKGGGFRLSCQIQLSLLLSCSIAQDA